MTSNEASKKTQKESKSTSKPINSNSKPERSRSKPSNSINKLEKSINEPINSSSRPKNSSRKLRKSSSKPEIKPKPIIKNRVRTAKALKEESSGDKSSELSNESAQKGQAKKKGAGEFQRKTKTAIQNSGSRAVARPAKESDREEECMRQKLSESSGTVTASSRSDAIKVTKQKEAEAIKEEDKMEPITSHDTFHGFRTEHELRALLDKDGNWLLCFIVSEKVVPMEARLVVRKGDRIYKLRLKLQENDAREVSFVIETYDEEDSESDSSSERSFLLVEQVIDHYKRHDLAVKTRLGEAVVPSKLMIRYSALQCDKRKVLGTGNFGQVSEGKLKLFSRMQRGMYMELDVAVKSSEEGQFNEPIRSEFRRKIVREASTMKELDGCVNVSLILGVCYDTPCIDVAVELCPGGSLYSHLLKFNKRISLEERLYFMYEISKGMKYIHKNKYLHRDLATRNCLISNDGRIKIADFGLSCKISDVADQKLDAKISRAPVRWMSPEAVASPPLFSYKSDVWSFGMCMYEIFNNGAEPWPGMDALQIKKLIQANRMPAIPKMPVEFRRILNQCWMLDRSLRPDFISIYRRLKKERKSVKNDELRVKRSRFTIFLIKGVYCRSKEEMFRSDAYFRSVRLFDAKMSSRKEAESQGSTKKKSTNSSDDM